MAYSARAGYDHAQRRGPMTLRPCLDCTRLSRAARCREHQQAYERRRGTSAERGYDANWRRVRARAIAAQPWCSVCFTTENLTGDHIVPLSRGGTSTPENVQVLCAFHQTQKGARF